MTSTAHYNSTHCSTDEYYKEMMKIRQQNGNNITKYGGHIFSLSSVSSVNTKGEVEINIPMGTPSWAANQEHSRAKTFERYSKTARRLQMKLMERGVKREDLAFLKSF